MEWSFDQFGFSNHYSHVDTYCSVGAWNPSVWNGTPCTTTSVVYIGQVRNDWDDLVQDSQLRSPVIQVDQVGDIFKRPHQGWLSQFFRDTLIQFNRWRGRNIVPRLLDLVNQKKLDNLRQRKIEKYSIKNTLKMEIFLSSAASKYQRKLI